MPPFQSRAAMPGIPISESMQIATVCSRFTTAKYCRHDQTPLLVNEQYRAGFQHGSSLDKSAPKTPTEDDDRL